MPPYSIQLGTARTNATASINAALSPNQAALVFLVSIDKLNQLTCITKEITYLWIFVHATEKLFLV